MNIISLNKIIIVWLIFTVMAGCGGDAPIVALEKDADQNKPNINANMVVLNPGNTRHIKVGKARYIETTEKFKVLSHVEVNENHISSVGANVTGRITALNASVGDTVKKGTPLAHISSTEFTQAQLSYLREFSETKLAEHAAERAKQLFSADVISHAELERRQSTYKISRAELSAAADHLRMFNMDKSAMQDLARNGQIVSTVTIIAPQDGIILKSNLAVGQIVQPVEQLFLVADLSSVWVVGDVPEQNESKVIKGQQVEVHVPALNNTSYNGHIVFVSDTLDPKKHTVMVRTQVGNADLKLKPAMLASMYITDSPKIHMVIPTSAVIRENHVDYVFIAQEENHFQLSPVKLGYAVNELRPVLDGLSVHQPIIIEGAFHANNQRKRIGLN